jgi:hypothetical protein
VLPLASAELTLTEGARIAIRALALVVLLSIVAPTPACVLASAVAPAPIRFIFTSDAHYGLHRDTFRGQHDVDAQVVNRAMIAAMNEVGRRVGPIDFIVEGGDVANREEEIDGRQVPPASVTWAQFAADYFGALRVRTSTGASAPLYVVPGNHDLANAIGFYRPMYPSIDRRAMASLFNRMMHPPQERTATTFDPAADVVTFSTTTGGVHFAFVSLWPDSRARAWLDRDLAAMSASTPVVLFAHDPPDGDARHFRNPNGAHEINETDRFENLLADVFADGPTVDTPDAIEQRAFERFLERHPNVVAYFHGHSNYNEFYDWRGPDRTIALHAFRVDSPMKGALSGSDETALSFQLATIAADRSSLTVRECLWNVDPSRSTPEIVWGDDRTVALRTAHTSTDGPLR